MKTHDSKWSNLTSSSSSDSEDDDLKQNSKARRVHTNLLGLKTQHFRKLHTTLASSEAKEKASSAVPSRAKPSFFLSPKPSTSPAKSSPNASSATPRKLHPRQRPIGRRCPVIDVSCFSSNSSSSSEDEYIFRPKARSLTRKKKSVATLVNQGGANKQELETLIPSKSDSPPHKHDFQSETDTTDDHSSSSGDTTELVRQLTQRGNESDIGKSLSPLEHRHRKTASTLFALKHASSIFSSAQLSANAYSDQASKDLTHVGEKSRVPRHCTARETYENPVRFELPPPSSSSEESTGDDKSSENENELGFMKEKRLVNSNEKVQQLDDDKNVVNVDERKANPHHAFLKPPNSRKQRATDIATNMNNSFISSPPLLQRKSNIELKTKDGSQPQRIDGRTDERLYLKSDSSKWIAGPRKSQHQPDNFQGREFERQNDGLRQEPHPQSSYQSKNQTHINVTNNSSQQYPQLETHHRRRPHQHGDQPHPVSATQKQRNPFPPRDQQEHPPQFYGETDPQPHCYYGFPESPQTPCLESKEQTDHGYDIYTFPREELMSPLTEPSSSFFPPRNIFQPKTSHRQNTLSIEQRTDAELFAKAFLDADPEGLSMQRHTLDPSNDRCIDLVDSENEEVWENGRRSRQNSANQDRVCLNERSPHSLFRRSPKFNTAAREFIHGNYNHPIHGNKSRRDHPTQDGMVNEDDILPFDDDDEVNEIFSRSEMHRPRRVTQEHSKEILCYNEDRSIDNGFSLSAQFRSSTPSQQSFEHRLGTKSQHSIVRPWPSSNGAHIPETAAKKQPRRLRDPAASKRAFAAAANPVKGFRQIGKPRSSSFAGHKASSSMYKSNESTSHSNKVEPVSENDKNADIRTFLNGYKKSSGLVHETRSRARAIENVRMNRHDIEGHTHLTVLKPPAARDLTRRTASNQIHKEQEEELIEVYHNESLPTISSTKSRPSQNLAPKSTTAKAKYNRRKRTAATAQKNRTARKTTGTRKYARGKGRFGKRGGKRSTRRHNASYASGGVWGPNNNGTGWSSARPANREDPAFQNVGAEITF